QLVADTVAVAQEAVVEDDLIAVAEARRDEVDEVERAELDVEAQGGGAGRVGGGRRGTVQDERPRDGENRRRDQGGRGLDAHVASRRRSVPGLCPGGGFGTPVR